MMHQAEVSERVVLHRRLRFKMHLRKGKLLGSTPGFYVPLDGWRPEEFRARWRSGSLVSGPRTVHIIAPTIMLGAVATVAHCQQELTSQPSKDGDG